jgi:Holliday junction resolvase RusA-like endonuclease
MREIKLNIKPLSVNSAWMGRRFKTPAYKQYEKDVLTLLPNIVLSEFKELELTFGMSNSLSDIDNPVKLIVDILQKKYNVNDRDLNRLVLNKVKTKKGEEFILIKVL